MIASIPLQPENMARLDARLGTGKLCSRSLDGATTLREYTWDWSNRLTSVDVGGLDTDYAYLGDDTRLSQTTSAGTTDYLIERQSGLPQVIDDGDSAYLHDVTGNSMAIDGTSSDATFPLSDALGSTRLTLDGTGTPLGSTDWDAWGNERYSDGTGYEFGYTGQQYDENADLYFNRARYFSPGTGQFLSRDTLQPNAGGATGYNAYQYANGNPTTFSDPGGHAAVANDAREFGMWLQAMARQNGIAFVYECMLDGACRYRNRHTLTYSDSAAVLNQCSSVGIQPKAVAFAGASPALLASTCSGYSRLNDVNLTPTPTASCFGRESGLGYDGLGPTGTYTDSRPGSKGNYHFDTLLLSNCAAAAYASGLKIKADSFDSLGTIAELIVAGALEVPLLAIHPGVIAAIIAASLTIQLGRWMQSMSIASQAQQLGSLISENSLSVLGVAMFSERETSNGRGRDMIMTQVDFFLTELGEYVDPCRYASKPGVESDVMLQSDNNCAQFITVWPK